VQKAFRSDGVSQIAVPHVGAAQVAAREVRVLEIEAVQPLPFKSSPMSEHDRKPCRPDWIAAKNAFASVKVLPVLHPPVSPPGPPV